MTASTTSRRRVIVGEQRPRVECVPDYVSSSGREAVELARMAGLELDDWQAYVLEHALGERPDGKWAAFEVGLCVPRQNGKGGVLEAMELAGLFLLGERLIIHSAHQFDTSLEAFRRLLALVEDTPEFDRRVKRVSRAHGEEGIELKGGQRVRFRTRTKGGGRGFTGDRLILDEAMILPEFGFGALLPTLSARPNPQVVYTGSAVDQTIHEHGMVLARVRDRALKGGEGARSLAYFEWSLDVDGPLLVDDETLGDQAAWAAANPAFGIRISPEHIGKERAAMDRRTFAVERLNVGDWPDVNADGSSVIDLGRWNALEDAASEPLDPVGFAYDVSPDRAYASVSAAGARADGKPHVEIIRRDRGTAWVAGFVAERVARNANVGVVCDAAGPAASLVADLAELGVEVTTVSASEHAQACGRLFDAVQQGELRHLGSGELRDAVKGAATRPLGDAWAWSRKNSAIDISPLVAATLALWAHSTAVEQGWGFVV